MSLELFQRIASVLPALDGWCSLEKANDLAAAVITLRPKVTVEIGVFGGKSFIPMALAARVCAAGLCYGIDPWSPTASMENQNQANADWWKNLDHKAVYRKFIDQLTNLGIEPHCRIFCNKSDDVDPPAQIDLLHIDGNHSDQAVRDVERFATRVRIGGMCFCDDIHWDGGGVERAVQKINALGFRQLYTRDTGAMFQRIRGD